MFNMYIDQKWIFNKLPDEKAGQLIKHIFSYVNDENPQTNDLIISIAFEPIKQQLKRDLIKRKKKCEKNSKNWKMGWRPIKDFKNSQKANGYFEKPNKAKKADTDTDTDKDKDIYNNIVEIINYLNNVSWKNFKSTTSKTKDYIKARYNEWFELDDFKKVIDIKTKEWRGTDQEKYIRPETLFWNKFEWYLNSSISNENKTMEDYLSEWDIHWPKYILDSYWMDIRKEVWQEFMKRQALASLNNY